MQGRDSSGHFQSGTMDPSTREKISKSRIETCRKARQFGTPPTHAKCTGPCGRYLLIEDNFHMQMKRLKDGDIIYRHASRCKECTAKRRSELHKQNREKILKQKKDQYKRRKKSRTKREQEEYRKKQREAARIRRALAGVEIRGPWIRYRHEVDERLQMVDVGPFVEWFTSLNGTTPSDGQLGDNLARAIRRAISGEVKKIHLDLVDEVGVIVGIPHLIYTLYPHI
jgi:hypothetical protein